jgi:glycosyltransferase involved in cell wall biosynthesis
MMVTIGILAYNEAAQIGNLIADLARQTLVSRGNVSIEVHVIANGCTDSTAAVARGALASPFFSREHVRTFVHELLRAGKSNAWNELIHSFAPPNTDYIFLLDADIRIPDDTSLEIVLIRLVRSQAAAVAIDESVSHLSEKTDRTIVERLINAGSATAYDTQTAICGQFYCARFDVLQEIWMPIGLPGEDGFLRAMIMTSNFSETPNFERIVFVKGVRHLFESEYTLRGVFRHNVRLAIGTAINVMLFDHLRASRAAEGNVGEYVRQRNEKDPNWINELISERLQKQYFLFNRDFVLKRTKRFSSLPIRERLKKGPIYLLGIIFDIVLSLRANHLMRKGAGAGFW